MPPAVPLNHYLELRNTDKIGEPRSYSIIPCDIMQALDACFEHSNFFIVNALATRDTQSRAPGAKRAAAKLREAARTPPQRDNAPTSRWSTEVEQ